MLGKLQRRVLRAFIAEPGRKTTTDLVEMVQSAVDRPDLLNKHRYGVRLAARRVAIRVGRTYPGGFIWELKPSHLLPSSKSQRE